MRLACPPGKLPVSGKRTDTNFLHWLLLILTPGIGLLLTACEYRDAVENATAVVTNGGNLTVADMENLAKNDALSKSCRENGDSVIDMLSFSEVSAPSLGCLIYRTESLHCKHS
jgi:hypothetical protein